VYVWPIANLFSTHSPCHRLTLVTDLIQSPDLSQARVNKCLIALVNRKVVQKNSSTVGLILSTSASFDSALRPGHGLVSLAGNLIESVSCAFSALYYNAVLNVVHAG
jgi:hypothetical protein